MSKRKLYIIGFLVLMCILVFTNTNLFKVFRSKLTSYISPVDCLYIKEREWINSRGRIISFDEGYTKIQGDTIFIDSEPIYKIRRLNKYLNEFVAISIKDNSKELFVDTEEFTR